MSNEKLSPNRGFENIDILDHEVKRTNHLLAIGISDYVYYAKLPNALKDVQDFANLMEQQFDFDKENIKLLENPEEGGIISALDSYRELTNKDNLVIYFAGHGILDEKMDEGYWIPKDAEKNNRWQFIPNTMFKRELEAINAQHIFVIVDACFGGAFLGRSAEDTSERLEKHPSRWGLTSGAKEPVSDGKSGENSPFAAALLHHLKTATEPVSVMRLCSLVIESTAANAKQTPSGEPLRVKGHQSGQFVFRPKNMTAATTVRNPIEDNLMRGAENDKLVRVKGGTFKIGDTHKITLKDFYIGKYPVTQREWVEVMGKNPSYFKGDNLPVECVSWLDVQKFIEKLNAQTGKKYRLPSEAEWEFAARGGTASKGFEYAGSNKLDEVGWFWQNSGDQRLNGEADIDKVDSNNCRTRSVGQKKTNELGLYDMSGNVFEWCQDVWADDYEGIPTDGSARTQGSEKNHVLRGGSWYDYAECCASTYRNYSIGRRESNYGFRLALSVVD